MYRFYATIHPRSARAQLGPRVTLDGEAYHTLLIERTHDTFPVTFEQAVEQLNRLPRMFCEPDGAFVWVGGPPDWQIDGNLYDGQSSLGYVELSGSCADRAWSEMLACFGHPDATVMFELPREGVFLEEAEFLRFAARNGANVMDNEDD